MKILKHGDKMPRKFTCKFCGCVFVADRSEYTVAASLDNFYTTCPDCNAKFDMHAPLYKDDDQFVIIDKKESTDLDDLGYSLYCNWMQNQCK